MRVNFGVVVSVVKTVSSHHSVVKSISSGRDTPEEKLMTEERKSPKFLKPAGIAVAVVAGVVSLAGLVWVWGKLRGRFGKDKGKEGVKKVHRRHVRDWSVDREFNEFVTSAVW
jgi:hypothetical protein